MALLAATFWTAVGLIAYAYVGYPLLLEGLCRVKRTRRGSAQRQDGGSAGASPSRDWPLVSLVIAAYREEKIILQRVNNALLMDYPADRLEILIGCDGDLDGTGDIVRSVQDSRVQLLQFPQRRGKPSVLNDCVAAARGEVVAFSDANTFWEPDALKQLVRHFDDPHTGGVCGQLLITDPVTGGNVDGAYWRYENFLKQREGELGALLGCNGAIYAIRRWLYEPIPPHTIVDDFLIGMRIHLRGKKLLFEEAAVANEESAPSIDAEFHRRTRIGAGGFQSLVWLRELLSPKHGLVSLAFWSHKVLRWLCPAFLALALAANVALALNSNAYLTLLIAQVLFYCGAILGRTLPGNHAAAKLARVASMFVGMNAALAVGFWKWAANRQSGAWKRTERSVERANPQPAPELTAAAGRHS